jgi:glycine cleavage system H protein
MGKKRGAPKEGEYQEGKVWFTRRGGVITIGLTSSAIEDLGEVESVELPSVDDHFEKDDVVLTIEGTNGSMEVTVPAGGNVVGTNENLQTAPELASEDPVETGWLIELELQDPTELMEYGEGDEEVEIGGED